MSTLTPTIGLKKPEASDLFLTQDFADNYDKIDQALADRGAYGTAFPTTTQRNNARFRRTDLNLDFVYYNGIWCIASGQTLVKWRYYDQSPQAYATSTRIGLRNGGGTGDSLNTFTAYPCLPGHGYTVMHKEDKVQLWSGSPSAPTVNAGELVRTRVVEYLPNTTFQYFCETHSIASSRYGPEYESSHTALENFTQATNTNLTAGQHTFAVDAVSPTGQWTFTNGLVLITSD